MTVTDRPEKLDQVGKVLAAFDTPPRGFTLRGQARARARRRPRRVDRPRDRRAGAKLKSLFQFNDYALIDSAVLRASRRAASTRSSATEYSSPSPIRNAGAGNELLLSPFSLSKIWNPASEAPVPPAPLPLLDARDPLADAGRRAPRKEEKSKSALILILLAQELPRGDAEAGADGPKAASKTDGSKSEADMPKPKPEPKP